MQNVRVESLMSRKVRYASPNTKIIDIVHALKDNCYSCMVIAKGNQPVGIITERDIVRLLANLLDNVGQPSQIKASDIMSSPPITIKQTETLFKALTIIQEQNIRHLIVVNSKSELTGLITQTDLTKAHFHILKTQIRKLEDSIKNIVTVHGFKGSEVQGLLKKGNPECKH